jgi:hypothetical protein
MIHESEKKTVYVPQRVTQFNISPAAAFGEIKFLKNEVGDYTFAYSALLESMYASLKKSTPGDYLLMVGDPVAFALAMHAMLKLHGAVNVLKWDKQGKMYYSQLIKGTQYD